MVDLGTLGGPSSAAAAVNQSGHVVGWAQIAGASSDVNWRAFLWTAASGMVDLGSLGGTYSVARDVNEAGAVVGTSAVALGRPGRPRVCLDAGGWDAGPRHARRHR